MRSRLTDLREQWGLPDREPVPASEAHKAATAWMVCVAHRNLYAGGAQPCGYHSKFQRPARPEEVSKVAPIPASPYTGPPVDPHLQARNLAALNEQERQRRARDSGCRWGDGQTLELPSDDWGAVRRAPADRAPELVGRQLQRRDGSGRLLPEPARASVPH
ncbi:MAG: hypothetical protein ACRESR_02110 [Gammaproteobacteria bacterium]